MPDIATDSRSGRRRPLVPRLDRRTAYEEAGIGPEDLSLAEVYDLAASMELDWYEYIGLCKPGEAEAAAAQWRDPHRRPNSRQCQWRARLFR